MHGNTISPLNGYKTRPFERILSEVDSLLRSPPRRGHPSRRHPHRDDRQERDRMHRRRAGAVGRGPAQDRYHTHCDPRLNADQALELAFLVAERMKGGRDEQKQVVNG
jgi:3-deoxy-7-phosphoheptulonate synthase